MPRDLELSPTLQDRISHLFLEHARIERRDGAVMIVDPDGVTPIPLAQIACLMLGPGTTITQEAVKAAAHEGTTLIWVGEEGVRFYAVGEPGDRSNRNLTRQAYMASRVEESLEVAARMLAKRFPELSGIRPKSMEEARGMEGSAMRQVYRREAEAVGVEWRERSRAPWNDQDSANRAVSWANACLYGLAHAAVLAFGYSPGLGFLHQGTARAFVFDIADLYKASVAVPVAMLALSEGEHRLERRVRKGMRDHFREARLAEKMGSDLQMLVWGEAGWAA